MKASQFRSVFSIMNVMKSDMFEIVDHALKAVSPEAAVKNALRGFNYGKGRLILVSVGKAAYAMGTAALEEVTPEEGIIISKYGHIKEKIDGIECYEAGHPLLDENSIKATKRALEMTEGLTEEDHVLFLLSGGASALFEYPKVSLEALRDINAQLLRSGAPIEEVNTIRKRLSNVKAGRFAMHCAPAKITTIVLSDILGDPLDMIGSGPTFRDTSTSEEAMEIVLKYHLRLDEETMKLLREETPKEVPNSSFILAGNLDKLIDSAREKCEELGYPVKILSRRLEGEASEAGRMIAEEALKEKGPLAILAGGETTVTVKGKGLGGRNQELVLSIVEMIRGRDILFFSFGSDGTDGPTDAAGAYADGDTYDKAIKLGIDIAEGLKDNDSYHVFGKLGQLIMTGPTGTNVNDLTGVLIR